MFLSLLPPALLVKYHTKYFLSAIILKLRKNVQHRRTYLWFIRLMRRWTKQIRALELFGEKNRLGRGSNLGQAGGNLCLWGPERFFSIVRNVKYTYPLFGGANI